MPHSYSSQYREMVLAQLRAGRTVIGVAAGLEVSEPTVFRWQKQDRIDRGQQAGESTGETKELRAARQRIVELEAERQFRRVKGYKDLPELAAALRSRIAKTSSADAIVA